MPPGLLSRCFVMHMSVCMIDCFKTTELSVDWPKMHGLVKALTCSSSLSSSSVKDVCILCLHLNVQRASLQPIGKWHVKLMTQC